MYIYIEEKRTQLHFPTSLFHESLYIYIESIKTGVVPDISKYLKLLLFIKMV